MSSTGWPAQIAILSENPQTPDGLSLLFADGFRSQGCEVEIFNRLEKCPPEVDFVLGYGPHTWRGSLVPAADQLLAIPPQKRPFFYFWYIESLPSVAFPLLVTRMMARIRLVLDRRLGYADGSQARLPEATWSRWARKGHRFRILGELETFRSRGLLGGLAITSASRAAYLKRLGFDPLVVPIGCHPQHHGDDLGRVRDIDVAFLGDLTSTRRMRILTPLLAELERRGVKVSVQDRLYNQARTEWLNRSKVLLNIFRAPQDFFGMRFLYAAANKVLFVSEPVQDSDPFVPGTHLVVAPRDQLVETIQRFLQDDRQRSEIVETAYQIVNGQYRIHEMAGRILNHARLQRQQRLSFPRGR